MSLSVVRAVGCVSVQDVGRPGRMHQGLAPGGALVPELLALANQRAGNPDDAAAIEVMGTATLRAESTVVVATDGSPAVRLETGAELQVTSGRWRAAYLAPAGGVDAPVVLGSRSAQPSAGLGRLLRAGDRLRVGLEPVVERDLVAFRVDGPIDVIAGPDVDAFDQSAFAVLTTAAWIVGPTSNRVGTRLEGARLARLARPDVTRPMVRGAIEVPPDELPIVLGPEHPTTGGYPVIAVIASEHIGRFHAVSVSQAVHFRLRV